MSIQCVVQHTFWIKLTRKLPHTRGFYHFTPELHDWIWAETLIQLLDTSHLIALNTCLIVPFWNYIIDTPRLTLTDRLVNVKCGIVRILFIDTSKLIYKTGVGITVRPSVAQSYKLHIISWRPPRDFLIHLLA
jgi:hypothetical protein